MAEMDTYTEIKAIIVDLLGADESKITMDARFREELEADFPQWLWHPRVYEAFELSPIDRLGYLLYDVWLQGPAGDRLARIYRRLRSRRQAAA